MPRLLRLPLLACAPLAAAAAQQHPGHALLAGDSVEFVGRVQKRADGTTAFDMNGVQVKDSLPDIQDRGRWAVLSSVRRYSKPHVLARVNAQLSRHALSWARTKLHELDRLGASCTLERARAVLADPPQ